MGLSVAMTGREVGLSGLAQGRGKKDLCLGVKKEVWLSVEINSVSISRIFSPPSYFPSLPKQ